MAKLKPGQSVAQAYDALKPHQKEMVRIVRDLKASQDQRLKSERIKVALAVDEALSRGVPARVLQEALNISTYVRVLQLRDDARAYLRKLREAHEELPKPLLGEDFTDARKPKAEPKAKPIYSSDDELPDEGLGAFTGNLDDPFSMES